MMNRTAEALFWIGRYLERIENHTRLMDVNYHMRHDLKSNEQNERAYMWERLVAAIGDTALFRERHKEATEASVLNFLLFDSAHNNSIFSCIRQARENVRSLRQLLPAELWEIINGYYLWMDDKNMDQVMMWSPHMFYQRVREWVSLFSGAADSMMMREREWYFIQAGKYLERAENTLRVLYAVYTGLQGEKTLACASDVYNRMIILLKSVSGYEAFRKCYADEVSCERVTQFMLLNDSFPRSAMFALHSLKEALASICADDQQITALVYRASAIIEQLQEARYGCNERATEQETLEAIESMLVLCDELGYTISKTFFQEEFVEA